MVVLPPLPTDSKSAGALRKNATIASALPTRRTPLASVGIPEKQQTLLPGGFVILSYAAVPHIKEPRG